MLAGIQEPELSLDQYPDEDGLSRERLRKRFRAAMGIPPARWLLEARLRRAQNELLSQENTIAEVARTVGFSDPFHFSRMFRRHLGVSPRTFRQRGG